MDQNITNNPNIQVQNTPVPVQPDPLSSPHNPPTQSLPNQPVQKTKRRRWGLFLIFPLMLVLLLAGGFVFAEAYYLKPENTIARAQAVLQEATSYTYSSEVTLEFEFTPGNFNFLPEEGLQNVLGISTDTLLAQQLDFPSQIPSLDSQPKSESIIGGISVELDGQVAQIAGSEQKAQAIEAVISFNMAPLNNIAVTTQGLFFPDGIYLKPEDIPVIGSSVTPMMQGKDWLLIPTEKPADEELLPGGELFEEIQNLQQLFAEENVFEIKTISRYSLIDGQPVRTYNITVDWELVKAILDQSEDIKPDSLGESILELLEKSQTLETTAVVTVGILDSKIYEYDLNATVKNADNSYIFTQQLTFDSYNDTSIKIEQPTSYISVEELVQAYVNSISQSSFYANPDDQRRADLYAITNAIYQYASENNGELPVGLENVREPTEIGSREGFVNLEQDLVPAYIARIPYDSLDGSDESTKYTIYLDQNGRVVAEARSDENPGTKIRVTR